MRHHHVCVLSHTIPCSSRWGKWSEEKGLKKESIITIVYEKYRQNKNTALTDPAYIEYISKPNHNSKQVKPKSIYSLLLSLAKPEWASQRSFHRKHQISLVHCPWYPNKSTRSHRRTQNQIKFKFNQAGTAKHYRVWIGSSRPTQPPAGADSKC